MSNQPAEKLERKRILIVDDHPLMRVGLGKLIDQQQDMTVCGEASDVSEGMTAVMSLEPDAVIVDISLTSGSGIDLIKSIHALRPDLPILALSVHHENLYAQVAIGAGARGYVMKRDPLEKLLEVLRDILTGPTAP